jgi:calcium-dependent protein kinase
MFESTAPDANVKVIDFGLSKKYLDPNSIIRDRVGTVYTMAPEVIEGVPYTSKTDMFSLGVIAYMLLSGTKPFWGRTKYEVARMARRCIYNFDGHVWSKISDDAKDFVSKLLVKDPSVRLSAVEAKRHVWLEKINLLSNKKPDMKLMNGVEESIVRFSDSGDFKKIVLNVLAHRTTTEDILELRKAFDSFDKENDGFISYDEFKEALSHINLGEEDLDRIFKSMDVNNTGDIMYNEFIAATLEAQHHIDEANLRDAFDRLDNDGTGYISKKNLCCVLGEHCTDEYVNNIIREVDVDGDGEISYDEFIAAFRQQKKNDIEKCGLVNDECVE